MNNKNKFDLIFALVLVVIFSGTVYGVATCTDTDDTFQPSSPFGFQPTIAGTTSWYSGGDYVQQADYCIDFLTLMEYSCTQGYFGVGISTQVTCPDGGYVGDQYCMNGDLYQDYIYGYCDPGTTGNAICNVTASGIPSMIEDCGVCCVNNQCQNTGVCERN